jgi:hypothetical protein
LHFWYGDVIPQAGISIQGPKELIFNSVESLEVAAVPMEVVTSSFEHMGLPEVTLMLDTFNKAEQNYMPLYAIYLLKMNELLATKFAINEALTGFFSLPDSKVKIDYQGAKRVNKRKYRIEFALHTVVDQQTKL